jgi:hypothetical protein
VQGCDYVFHVAAVVSFDTTNPEQDIIKPAVEGVTDTHAVLPLSLSSAQALVTFWMLVLRLALCDMLL